MNNDLIGGPLDGDAIELPDSTHSPRLLDHPDLAGGRYGLMYGGSPGRPPRFFYQWDRT